MKALILLVLIFVFIIKAAKNKKESTPTKKTVVKTKFIDSSHTATSSSEAKVGSAIARGAVGGLLLGPLGMVAGAATAKKKTTVVEHHKTTFMVYFSNGERRVETVENSSDLYRLYMSKLDMGD